MQKTFKNQIIQKIICEFRIDKIERILKIMLYNLAKSKNLGSHEKKIGKKWPKLAKIVEHNISNSL